MQLQCTMLYYKFVLSYAADCSDSHNIITDHIITDNIGYWALVKHSDKLITGLSTDHEPTKIADLLHANGFICMIKVRGTILWSPPASNTPM